MSDTAKNQNKTYSKSYSPKKPDILRMAKERLSQIEYPESFLLPNRSNNIPPQEGHNCPAYVTFANEFSYFMDYSGQGFGFIDFHGWRCDINYTLADILTGYAMRPVCLDVTVEGLEHLYHTVGLSYQVFYANSLNGEYMNEADMKESIRYTLKVLGRPVILRPIEGAFFGAVVVGYEQNGDTLITYSYPPYFIAPDNTKPEIKTVKNWYNIDTTITIIGERKEGILVKEVYKEGLRQVYAYLKEGVYGQDQVYYNEWKRFLRQNIKEMIAEVKRTRKVPSAYCIGGILEDEATEERVLEVMNTIVDPTWCEMAERRYYIMHFFRQAALHFPEEKEAIRQIEKHFGWSNSLMGDAYVKEVGHDPVNTEAFYKQEVRNRMADLVQQFQDADAKGLMMVEELLKRMGI